MHFQLDGSNTTLQHSHNTRSKQKDTGIFTC